MISTGTSNLSDVIQSIIDTSSSPEHDYQTNNRATGKKRLKGYGPGHTQLWRKVLLFKYIGLPILLLNLCFTRFS